MEKCKHLENFISVEFLMKELGMPIRGQTTVSSVASNLKEYASIFDFSVAFFPDTETFPDGIKSKFGVSKSFLELLQKNYVSLAKVREQTSNTTVTKMMKIYKPEIIKLQQTVKTGMFIKKDDLYEIPLYNNIVKSKLLRTTGSHLSKSEMAKALGLSLGTMSTVIRDYKVEGQKISKELFFSRETLDYLKNEQEKAHKLLEDYYLGSEVRDMIGNYSSSKYFGEKFDRIPCPSILPIENPADKSGFLWRKTDVYNYLEEKKKREITKIELDTPFETFLYRVPYLGLDLSPFPVTQDLWFQYVKERLSYTGAKDKTKYRYIGNLLESTRTLFTGLSEEIYKMSSPEINMSLLNENIEISHRFRLYLFLKQTFISFEETEKTTKYTLRTLNDPYKDYKPEGRDSDCYSIVEYQELFTFAQDTVYHKQRAIDDTIKFLQGGKTNSYCSVWVYVITHLSNNWRHSTVTTELPRLDLSRINAQSLEWLSENDITQDEAKDIVYQVGRHIIDVNKTGAESYFNLPDKLAIPFATAAIICELRLRALGIKKGPLINIPSDKTVNSRAKGSFFNTYPDDTFKFENRKMNRSLTTYIWSIINYFSTGKDDALVASQFSRSHYTESSTNIYIKLTQKQIDELSEQLFSRNQFGFVYKMFSDLLLGKPENKQEETSNIEAIQREFGDIFKIEATAGFINKLSERQLAVKNFVNDLSADELRQMHTLLLANLLPAKEKHYQCIKKECIYKELNCKDCPISIPNVYSLTDTMDKYVKQIENLLQFEQLPTGEKMRQANQFFLIRKQIEEARTRFGKDIIYTFLPGGKERIIKLQALLPPKNTVASYITVNKEKVDESIKP